MLSLDQTFQCLSVSPEQMDRLWAQGWRHFGTFFFRYQIAFHRGKIHTVTPLRLDLERFTLSRSQKRVLAKNREVKVIIQDTVIDKRRVELFHIHSKRFKENVPTSLYDFLSVMPSSVPCQNQEISVYLDKKLVASSFLDIGKNSTSAVYAMFEPAESRRSLGIFTMLEAIRYSRERGCRYYYPGYAYQESSFYDYKKNFSGLEYMDWEKGWFPLKGDI
jgi:arginine-tRNA-protein transferase